MDTVDTAAWAVLPVLDLGPSRKRARFLSRLSFSSLSSLFSAPLPPDPSTLEAVKDIAFDRDEVDKDALFDALCPVAAFTTHLRDAVRSAEDGDKNALSPSDIAKRGAALLAAYVHSAMATSRYIAAQGGQVKVSIDLAIFVLSPADIRPFSTRTASVPATTTTIWTPATGRCRRPF